MGWHRGGMVDEKRSPKGCPVFPKAGTAPAIGRSRSHCSPPQPRGKAQRCQCQAGCAPSSLGIAGACSLLWWVTPDWVGLGLLCSPAQDHAAGGGSAVRGCVGRHNEDVCELRRAGLLTSTRSAGEGTPVCGCQAGVPGGLFPHSAPACCAGPRGRDHDLEPGFLLRHPTVGTAPVVGAQTPS